MEKKTKKIIYLSLFFISCILILFCISLSKSKTTKKEKIVNKTKNSTTYEEKDGRKKIIIYNANIRFEDEQRRQRLIYRAYENRRLRTIFRKHIQTGYNKRATLAQHKVGIFYCGCRPRSYSGEKNRS